MEKNEKIQQLKQLLDEGILSQEEFEFRKQQVLSFEDDEADAPRDNCNVKVNENSAGHTMKLCPNCGTRGDVMFCPECGTKMIDESGHTESSVSGKVCPKCGYEGDYAFCPECGSQMVAAGSINNKPANHVKQNDNAVLSEQQISMTSSNGTITNSIADGKEGSKKKIVIGVVSIGVVILIVIIAVIAGSIGKQTITFEDYSFKIPKGYQLSSSQDNQSIYTVDPNKIESLLLFDKIYDSSYDSSSFKENKLVYLETYAQELAPDTTMAISDDGSFSGVEINGINLNGKADAFYDEEDESIYIVVILQDENSSKNYVDKIKGITKSAKKLSSSSSDDNESNGSLEEYEEQALNCAKKIQEAYDGSYDLVLYDGLAVYVNTKDTGTGSTLTLVPYSCDGVEGDAIFEDGEYVMDANDSAPDDGSAVSVYYSTILENIKNPSENGFKVYNIDPDKIMRQL